MFERRSGRDRPQSIRLIETLHGNGEHRVRIVWDGELSEYRAVLFVGRARMGHYATPSLVDARTHAHQMLGPWPEDAIELPPDQPRDDPDHSRDMRYAPVVDGLATADLRWGESV